MNVVITCAGHSRRFREAGYELPKFLLTVGDKPMIEHVLAMFDPEDRIHIVVSRSQADQFSSHLERIKGAHVHVVPDHDLGPVHSALQADIEDDEELIVSYCDFIVEWDSRRFIDRCRGHAGGIATFKGFHPASFGNTMYAYVRNDGDKVLELREKRNFTADRTQEHANAGIYYFKSGNLFREYAAKVFAQGYSGLSEAYVSLLYPHMLSDGLDVVLHEVEKFICLGTPEDLRQYQFWWRYFKSEPQQSSPILVGTSVVPMAGQGTRFLEQGYRTPKPLISVRGAPMYESAIKSFPAAKRWVFPVRAEDASRFPDSLPGLSDTHFVPVEGGTEGQACTCLLAEDLFLKGDSLLISSCDYQTVYDESRWRALVQSADVDGIIWTMRLAKQGVVKDPHAFAYCVPAADGRTVEKVVEKSLISDNPLQDHAVVGSFWFRRAEDFVTGAKEMIRKDIRVNGEFYVGTSINQLVERGARFVVFEVDQWISFGDPFELRTFAYWEEFFEKGGRT